VASSVLDASALLAFLRKESGEARVLTAILAGTSMTTVNFAEVATWYMRNGADEAYVRAMRARLVFPLAPIDDDLAIRAAVLEPITRSAGLSLGDRLCLASVQRENSPAITSDRGWAAVAKRIGIEIELLR
jgi:ribonuclease VapC